MVRHVGKIALFTAMLLVAALPVPAGVAMDPARASAPSEAAADNPRPSRSPLRVMVPTNKVRDQLEAQGYSDLGDVITTMKPSAAYSPGPQMPILASPDSPTASDPVISPTVFRTLAILVDFSDKTSQVSASYFDTLVFGTSGTATVNRFYDEASYGLLDIVTLNLPSSMGWQRVPQTLAYYAAGQDCIDGVYPHNCQKLAEDVTALVNPIVDFSQYDNDGDGFVDTVFIIHSGQGAEFTGNHNDIWSHSWWTLTEPLYDGVRVGSYTTEPEYFLAPGDMTHGVFSHELGHALGLPDLYDIDNSSEGIGDWSLMSGGSWNGPSNMGASPAQLDAWSRVFLGFNDAVNVSGTDQTIDLPSVVSTQSGSIYRLDGANSNEYWLLENRQKTGSDAYLPAAGLLIWHIDNAVVGSNDTECLQQNNWLCAGNNNHFRVALEQADGLYQLENNVNQGNGGDPYPGTTNNRTFSFATNPNSSSYYTSSNLGVVLASISDSGPTMTAHVGAVTSGLWDDYVPGDEIPQLPYESIAGDTSGATLQAGEPVPSCVSSHGHSVWFAYTPPVAITITADTFGSNYDTVLAVYQDSWGDPVVCNDDSGGNQSRVQFAVDAGSTWYFQVSSYHATAGGALQFHLTGDGLLRATTSPAVPSQIIVDGVPRDTWGLTWTKLPPGDYEVSFADVPGFTTPAPQTVTITPGETATLTGAFVPRGYLRVITNPAVPATIFVDSTPRNDWGMWTDLAPGNYQVCFGDVDGYTAPGCQNATVTVGATTTVTGTYTALAPGSGSGPAETPQPGEGMLRVTSNPAVPTQIMVDGIPMDTWGLTWVSLPAGDYEVSFTDVPGFTTPAPQTATVVAGETTTVTGAFVSRGYLRVITNPAVPATIFIDGAPRNDWGMWTDLAPGSYQVCYGDVVGYSTPVCQNTSVTAPSTTTVTGSYSL